MAADAAGCSGFSGHGGLRAAAVDKNAKTARLLYPSAPVTSTARPEGTVKTALIHYWLTGLRGGERTLAHLCGLFPDADLYTHACLPGRAGPAIGAMRTRETFIARLPWGRRRPQMYLPLMPRALAALDLDAYGLVISSESGPAKGVFKGPGAVHLCYCHTPMRYLWDLHDDYRRQAGPLGRLAMKLFVPRLRRHDLASAEGVDHFAANSRHVAGRVQRLYGRGAEVIYPPVDVERFAPPPGPPGPPPRERGHYLYLGQLAPYKRPDLAVAACLRMGRRLVVAGRGPMLRRLRRQARGAADIHFAGPVGDGALPGLYAGARALLFPGIEDFGIVPVEAMASGTPVVAYGQGGALETVAEGQTGLFFREPAVESLCQAMEEMEGRPWDDGALRAQAARFGAGRFRAEFMDFVRRHTGIQP